MRLPFLLTVLLTPGVAVSQTLDIGGVELSLGMTTEGFLGRMGSQFLLHYVSEDNSYLIMRGTESLGAVYLRSGKVEEVQKSFECTGSGAAACRAAAFELFQVKSRGATCRRVGASVRRSGESDDFFSVQNTCGRYTLTVILLQAVPRAPDLAFVTMSVSLR